MRRLYLREAVCSLLFVRLAVRFIGPERVFKWTARPPRHIRRFADDEVAWVSWALETVDLKGWMKASSASRALAAQTMLRRRGISSRLCLGVARDDEALVTHAWVEVDQIAVFGSAEASRSVRLAVFGEARS
jgi:transglutaminase superfamily protein